MSSGGDILRNRRKSHNSAKPTGPGPDVGLDVSTGSTAGHSPGVNPLKKKKRSDGQSLFETGGVTKGGGAREASGLVSQNIIIEGSAGDVPVDKLNPEQMRRYQAWKRSRLERSDVSELILDRAAPTMIRSLETRQGTGVLKETSTLMVASVAKMYVGDLVEEVKRAQLSRGESGPLKPKDLLDARDRLAASGKGPPLSSSSGRAPGAENVRARTRKRLGGGHAFIRGNAI